MDSYTSITGDLPPERLLDQLRTRLAGLHTALQRMKISLDPSNPAPENYPLPPWKDLEAFHTTVASHLSTVSETLSDPAKSRFLKQAHIHPTSQYPAQAEDILNILLRKRLAPEAETWLDQGVKVGQSLEAQTHYDNSGHMGESEVVEKVDWEKLWEWAGPAENSIALEIFPELAVDEEPTTLRKEKEPFKEETKPMMALDDVLRFTSSGTIVGTIASSINSG